MMLATARSTSGVGSSAVGRSSAMVDVEHGLGLGVHLLREIEAREIEPRRGALQERRVGGGANQIELPLHEIGLAVVAPALGVERHRAGDLLRCGAAASDSVRPPGRDQR